MKTWKCPFCEETNEIGITVCHLCNKSNTFFKEESGLSAVIKERKEIPAIREDASIVPDKKKEKPKPLVTFEKSKPVSLETTTRSATLSDSEETLNTFWIIIAFLFPIIGLIMGLSMSSSKKSKTAYQAAGWGFLVGLILAILSSNRL